MNGQIVLTPAESKKLIAKGVARLPFVREALAGSMVAIAKGTTNSYIVEEITGRSIEKKKYITGLRLPAKDAGTWVPKERLADVVLKAGRPLEGVAAIEAVAQMQRGDVFIKGANALDYRNRIAGIYIGHPTGGTIGAVYGTIIARGIRLVIPVGLEKLIAGDLAQASTKLAAATYESGAKTGLFPVTGEIVTEIEALQVLYGVEAVQIGAGGVGGAEGSVHLLISGEPAAVRRAMEDIEKIQGEPPFAEL